MTISIQRRRTIATVRGFGNKIAKRLAVYPGGAIFISNTYAIYAPSAIIISIEISVYKMRKM